MLSSNDQEGKRIWVYPMKAKGQFRNLRRRVGTILIAILVLIPWIPIGGHPALQLDIPGRHLYAFGQVFTPRDNLLMVLGLLAAGLTFLMVSTLFGRLWCGYACPQTVFLEEIVRPLERLIEGPRSVRRARDKRAFTFDSKGFDKAWRKVAKLGAYAAISALIGLQLGALLSPPIEVFTGKADGWVYGFAAVIGVSMFIDFAWFREQFCSYLCPYARFQGALTDEQSLLVQYRNDRGEPRRGSVPKGQQSECIDCKKCVAVCPAGIDIRDGFQLDCISCAACVDACSGVMERFNKPSLVEYTTPAELAGGDRKIVRPRVMIYSALLLVVLAGAVWQLTGRDNLEATVNRAAGTLYQVDEDGWIRNTYLLQVVNNGDEDMAPTITLEGVDDAELVLPPVAAIKPEARQTIPVVVRVPPDANRPRTLPIQVVVSAGDEELAVDTTFKSGT